MNTISHLRQQWQHRHRSQPCWLGHRCRRGCRYCGSLFTAVVDSFCYLINHSTSISDLSVVVELGGARVVVSGRGW